MARNKVVEFYSLSVEDRESWVESMKGFVVILDVKEHYTIGQLIGNGNFARVNVCHKKKDLSKKFALKTVRKSTIKSSSRNIVSGL